MLMSESESICCSFTHGGAPLSCWPSRRVLKLVFEFIHELSTSFVSSSGVTGGRGGVPGGVGVRSKD